MDVEIDANDIIASFSTDELIVKLTCEIMFDVESDEYLRAFFLVMGEQQATFDVFEEGEPILRVKEVYMALRETGEVFTHRPKKNNTILYFPCSYSRSLENTTMYWKVKNRTVFFECNGCYAFDPSCVRINFA